MGVRLFGFQGYSESAILLSFVTRLISQKMTGILFFWDSCCLCLPHAKPLIYCNISVITEDTYFNLRQVIDDEKRHQGQVATVS